jgi:transcription antitermination factor NusG
MSLTSMTTTLTPEQTSQLVREELSDTCAEVRWYVAQTCCHHEKRVAQQLASRGIQHFLPLYEKVGRWKERRVRLQMPLFPGYIFVRMPLRERLRALEISSVASLVGFGGVATPLPDFEIDALQKGLASQLRAEPHPHLKVGRRVRIKSGPLAGLEGILIRKKGSLRFVVSVDLIQRSVAADVDVADIAPVC